MFLFQLGFVYLIRPCRQRNRIGDPAKCTQSDGSLLVRDSLAIYFVRLIFTSQLSAFHEYLPASSLHQNAFLTNPFLDLKGLYFRQICQAPLLRFLFVLFSILQCRILFRKSKLSMNVLENDDATLPLCRRSGSFPLKKAFWLIICLFHNVFACKIQTILLIVSVVKSMSDHFTIL